MYKLIKKYSEISSSILSKLVLTIAIVATMRLYSATGFNNTHYVLNTNDSGADSLRQAMIDAAPGDYIDITAINNIAAINDRTINLSSDLPTIDKSIFIIGTGDHNTPVIIDGQGLYRIFHVTTNGALSLDKSISATNAGVDGGALIESGTIHISTDASLGDDTDELKLDSGVLQLNFDTLGINVTSSRPIELTNANTIDTDVVNLDHSGTISGTGTLVKQGTGTLTLSGSNENHSGNTSISAGTLKSADYNIFKNNVNVSTGATAEIASSTNATHSANFSGDGSVNINPSNNSTITLTGISSHTGGTTVSAGTLKVGSAANLGSGQVTLNNGTSLEWSGAATASNNVNLASGSATVNTGNNEVTHSGQVTGSGTLNKAGTGTLTLSNTNAYSGGTQVQQGTLKGTGVNSLQGDIAISQDATLIFGQNDATFYSGALSGYGTVRIQPTNDATITFSGNNTYTGGTTLKDGTLSVSSGNHLGTGSISFDGGDLQWSASATASNPISVSGGGGTINTGIYDITHSGDVSGSGTLSKAGSGILTLSNDTSPSHNVTLNVTEGTLKATGPTTLRNSVNVSTGATVELAPSGDKTHSAGFAGLGSLNINPTGAATVTLTGNSTHTGGTTVSAGTLKVGSAANLGSDQVTLNNGTSLEWSGAATASNDVNLASGSATINTGSNSVTHSGVVSGTGALNKTGSGTLTLSSTNTYSGGTTLSAGTLSVSSTSNLGSNQLTFNGGTLEWTAAATASHDINVNANG